MIKNIKLPVEFDNRFTPPNLEQIFDFYPQFAKQYSDQHDIPTRITFQTYMSLVLKELDLKKPNGFNGQEAFDAFIKHNGDVQWFIDKYHDFSRIKYNDSKRF